MPLIAHMLKNVGFINCFRGVGWAPGLCLLVGLFSCGMISADFKVTYPLNLDFCLRMTLFIQPLLLTGISLVACIIEKQLSVWRCRGRMPVQRQISAGLPDAVYGNRRNGFCSAESAFGEQCGRDAGGKNLSGIGSSVSAVRHSAYGVAAVFAGEMVLDGAGPLVWAGVVPVGQNSYQPGLTLWMDDAPLPVLLVAALGAAVFYFWQTRQLALSKTNEKMGGYWKC